MLSECRQSAGQYSDFTVMKTQMGIQIGEGLHGETLFDLGFDERVGVHLVNQEEWEETHSEREDSNFGAWRCE